MANVPDEAVEAACRAVFLMWDDPHTGDGDKRCSRALVRRYLEAAAPLIAEAKTEDLRKDHARLLAENADLRNALRGVLGQIALLDGEPPTEDEVAEAREIVVRACQQLSWKNVQCECEGCQEQIPEWWASGMCFACSDTNCEHEEADDE